MPRDVAVEDPCAGISGIIGYDQPAPGREECGVPPRGVVAVELAGVRGSVRSFRATWGEGVGW